VRTDTILLTHTTLAALTPLIPIPFVDDYVRAWLLRRLVRALAEAHNLPIWDDEVRTLIDEPRKSYIGSFFKGLILTPVRKILRKTFMVLAGKRVVELATEVYHRGWLIELALDRGWCAPHGVRSATEVRAGIEEVLKQMPVIQSPVTSALRVGFERSQSTLADVFATLRSLLARYGYAMPADDQVARVVEEAEAEGVDSIVEQLRRALMDVPQEHFDRLDELLTKELAPSDMLVGSVDDA